MSSSGIGPAISERGPTPTPARTKAGRGASSPAATIGGLSIANLLTLQKFAGNRAVGRVLQRYGADLRPLQRTLDGNVLGQSISPDWARALTDQELQEQLSMVRSAAAAPADEVMRQAAHANLSVLEQEAVRRNPHGASPRAAQESRPPAQPGAAAQGSGPRTAAIIGPPLSLAFGAGAVVPVAPVPPVQPPPFPTPPPTWPGPSGHPGTWQYRPPPGVRPPPTPAPGPGIGARPWWVPGAFASAVIAGIVVFLWPRETAPPWMDTLNPLTGRPYSGPEEYDSVRRMSPEAFRDAMSRRRRAPAPSETGEPAETGEGGQRPPSNSDCDKAIKLLEQYERLAAKLGTQLPPARIAHLNAMRDSGQIRGSDLPGRLQREWPGGQFDGKTLDEIRALCGRARRNRPAPADGSGEGG